MKYEISEKNYDILGCVVSTSYEIKDPKNKEQDKQKTIGDTANIIGVNNYDIDNINSLDTNNILNINFINVYSDNIPTVAMPETGGNGIYYVYIIGITLIIIPCIKILMKRRKCA